MYVEDASDGKPTLTTGSTSDTTSEPSSKGSHNKPIGKSVRRIVVTGMDVYHIRNVKCTVSFSGRAVSGNTTDDEDPALRPASETLKRRCAAVV
ncbi:hypothetical protein CROQUDRAFT_101971 [Cronartium quercuum f. sp. fusiforme G11]|uniref:Uncharacterized protein n=1 Tax=Cronartium quercuum f. sp. fusiforme G11 TaxID=708437 RepID=A0A9P6N506_9BASI|nr:hypothetical protein CROQUDRAFT_101971 [Cronartium quercuum f. sp. fusiforme G11]